MLYMGPVSSSHRVNLYTKRITPVRPAALELGVDGGSKLIPLCTSDQFQRWSSGGILRGSIPPTHGPPSSQTAMNRQSVTPPRPRPPPPNTTRHTPGLAADSRLPESPDMHTHGAARLGSASSWPPFGCTPAGSRLSLASPPVHCILQYFRPGCLPMLNRDILLDSLGCSKPPPSFIF